LPRTLTNHHELVMRKLNLNLEINDSYLIFLGFKTRFRSIGSRGSLEDFIEMVINRQILPEPIFSYFHSEKVRLSKENDNIILTPINSKPNANELRGMFNDGKISTADFIAQKAAEKDMEL